MGRLFSMDAVAARRIPTQAGFVDVIREVRTTVPTIPGFIGGLQCGSTLMGVANHRSDVDIVVVYDGRDTFLRELQVLSEIAHGRHVPLKWIPIPNDIARAGFHTITSGFHTHLEWAAENQGVFGENPLTWIKLAPSSARKEARDYLEHQVALITKRVARFPVLEERDQLRVGQSAIEAPFHGARRVLEASGIDCANIRKVNLVEAFADQFPNTDRVGYLQQLFQYDNYYSAALVSSVREGKEQPHDRALAVVLTQGIRFALAFLKETLLSL